MRGRIKGFTLIELIVVIAIIGILAAILVPSMLNYVKNAKISQYNTNAKSVFSGAQLAITDAYNYGGYVEPEEIFINSTDGAGQCTGQSSGDVCDITDYVGEHFKGYFGFKMDEEGTGAEYALWSDHPISASDFTGLYSYDDVKTRFETRGNILGCHPLKPEEP